MREGGGRGGGGGGGREKAQGAEAEDRSCGCWVAIVRGVTGASCKPASAKRESPNALPRTSLVYDAVFAFIAPIPASNAQSSGGCLMIRLNGVFLYMSAVAGFCVIKESANHLLLRCGIPDVASLMLEYSHEDLHYVMILGGTACSIREEEKWWFILFFAVPWAVWRESNSRMFFNSEGILGSLDVC
ncbi:hypothetical protein Taro_001645 [Colocasia esculenta]|uniref:Uncharacterized protein n=1 Tax=Colocasia esculenta TaxID=4460 RepID=A0A843TIL7_COLES|nr:hypothetical protein [Colocasia esculenta]